MSNEACTRHAWVVTAITLGSDGAHTTLACVCGAVTIVGPPDPFRPRTR